MSDQPREGLLGTEKLTQGDTIAGRVLNTLRIRHPYAHEGDDTAEVNDLDDHYYQDEQEQEELIAALTREDIMKNEFYCKTLWMLCTVSMPYFAIRLFYSHTWLNVLCFASLMLSFCSCPSPKTQEFGLVKPPWYMLWLQWWNIIGSGIMLGCVHYRFNASSPDGAVYPRAHWRTDSEILVVYPFVVAMTVFLARKFMEAINFDELHKLRYDLKGA